MGTEPGRSNWGCAIWIFTRFGFYSIACASRPDGSIDRDAVMVRARCKDHLQNLQTRFPALVGARIVSLRNRDYRYRMIVPKSVWVTALRELAEEQEWNNFKNEVARHQGPDGAAYTRALHDVWEIMNRLQAPATRRSRP